MKIITAIATFALIGGSAVSVTAQTFDQTHPRRAEVNGRLADQNARIQQGVKDGQLSRNQAHQLHAEERAIRAEERADARVNGGHITKGEQRTINQQENANSRAIYGERH